MDKPNLELPRRVAVSRPIFDRRSTFFLVLGAAAFAALMWVQLRTRSAPGAHRTPSASVAGGLSADALERLALRLEDKNLSAAAVETWRDWLAASGAQGANAARVYARMGRLLSDAGRHDEAVACYYRAEMLAPGDEEAVGRDLAKRVRDSFAAMGRYAELAREVAQRASIQPGAAALSGRQVVARIGDEEITAADLERLIADELDQALAGVPAANAADSDAARRRAHEQFSSPEARMRFLQQVITRRVLADEARRRGLDQDEAYRRRLVGDAESLLASHLAARIVAERAVVTPQDVERYYEANKSRYATPATADIARIVCTGRSDAKEVIAALDDGADFADLVKERSIDDETKSRGGRLPEPLAGPDGPGADLVPGVGRNRELHGMIWGLKPGEYLKEPVQVGGRWHVYKMMAKRRERTPPLDEVRRRVEADCEQARREEVLHAFVGELFERHRVRLNPAAATTRPASAPPARRPDAEPGAPGAKDDESHDGD
jgi:peptidyl-prolyl cis-trans isomerase C